MRLYILISLEVHRVVVWEGCGSAATAAEPLSYLEQSPHLSVA